MMWKVWQIGEGSLCKRYETCGKYSGWWKEKPAASSMHSGSVNQKRVLNRVKHTRLRIAIKGIESHYLIMLVVADTSLHNMLICRFFVSKRNRALKR